MNNTSLPQQNETGLKSWEVTVERPLTPDAYVVIGVYLTFIGILATMGNVTVIGTILRSKTMRQKPQVLLLLNVAVADLGISVTGYPYATSSAYAGHWLFGYIGCQCYAFLCFFFSMASMDTLVAISIYRYIIIVKPKYQKNLTYRNTVWVIVAAWFYSFLWTSPPLYGWSHYTYEPFGTSCSMNWQGKALDDITYIFGTTIFCYLLHITILLFCYVKIIQTTRLTDGSWNVPTRPQQNGLKRKRLGTEVRVTMMCSIMVVTFIIVWTPYAVISIWHAFDEHVPTALLTLPTMFAKSGCICNPIIYTLLNTRFRRQMCKLWCPCFVRSIFPAPPWKEEPRRSAEQKMHTMNIFCVEKTMNKEGVFVGRKSRDCWTDLESDVNATYAVQATGSMASIAEIQHDKDDVINKNPEKHSTDRNVPSNLLDCTIQRVSSTSSDQKRNPWQSNDFDERGTMIEKGESFKKTRKRSKKSLKRSKVLGEAIALSTWPVSNGSKQKVTQFQGGRFVPPADREALCAGSSNVSAAGATPIAAQVESTLITSEIHGSEPDIMMSYNVPVKKASSTDDNHLQRNPNLTSTKTEPMASSVNKDSVRKWPKLPPLARSCHSAPKGRFTTPTSNKRPLSFYSRHLPDHVINAARDDHEDGDQFLDVCVKVQSEESE